VGPRLTPWIYAAYAAGGLFGATAFGVFVYLAVSFFLMRAHVTPRSAGATLRELVRETFWVVLTQPLVPLYYLRGHAMGGDGPGDVIVFVHGYFQNRANFVGLARGIRLAHVGPMFGFNYPWVSRVEKNAARLARFVEKVCAASGREHVALVAHSLGGLVALEYLHSEAGARRVRKCVTIASPHAGIPWRGPILGEVGEQMRSGSAWLTGRAGRKIEVPTLSIYSTHDNMVYPPATSQLAARGGRDVAVDGLGHLAILFDPKVVGAVVDFLRASA
jgi:triacylglycerol lipase